MPKNVSTKKELNHVTADIAGHVASPRVATAPNRPGRGVGQMSTTVKGAFAEPMNNGINAPIKGLGRTYDDIGERSGFVVDGYLDKGNTPYGEAAKFNFLPPGMEIDNQVNSEINEMPLYRVTAESYPGDGWMPEPRDIPE